MAKKAKKVWTSEDAERSLESLRNMARKMVAEMAQEAIVRCRPMLVAGIMNWDKDEKALRDHLEKQLREVITMAQESNGYCSIQGVFFTTAMPVRGGSSISVEIAKWLGCGFVMTTKAIRPQVRKLILKLPVPSERSRHAAKG